MRVKLTAALLLSACTLAACQSPGQNTYDAVDAGQVTDVQFGTIITLRHVTIQAKDTGLGLAAGAGIGGMLGSLTGSAAASLAAAVAGGGIGGVAEHVADQKVGIEYTITLAAGRTITVAQYEKSDDQVLHQGERVMVQTTGSYQRVLPADNLPTEIERPKGIVLRD